MVLLSVIPMDDSGEVRLQKIGARGPTSAIRKTSNCGLSTCRAAIRMLCFLPALPGVMGTAQSVASTMDKHRNPMFTFDSHIAGIPCTIAVTYMFEEEESP